MSSELQLSLMDSLEAQTRVAEHVKCVLEDELQPSPFELIERLARVLGTVARWDLESALRLLLSDNDLTRSQRAYLNSLLESDDLVKALRGQGAPDHETTSTIDALFEASAKYRNSAGFREMVDFMGRFHYYAPYNNMLVRLQNPSCSFYATAKHWHERFGRSVKEDARPMLILAPRHPVMPVYDLDQTEGRELPAELLNFAKFKGQWQPRWLEHLVENARRHQIRVDFKDLSSTRAGFATSANPMAGEKMRIAAHAGLSPPSQFGVLCHEMAHILLGHLGSDADHWWPSRSHLGRHPIEVEAEATAYIVTRHLRLEGASAAYVSRYLDDRAEVPKGVSRDMIAKVSSRIENMALKIEPAPLTKSERAQRKRRRAR